MKRILFGALAMLGTAYADTGREVCTTLESRMPTAIKCTVEEAGISVDQIAELNTRDNEIMNQMVKRYLFWNQANHVEFRNGNENFLDCYWYRTRISCEKVRVTAKTNCGAYLQKHRAECEAKKAAANVRKK
jgi:hypothetical protein